MIIGRQLVENQYEEKLYSTGDDYLDELLEKAFCEGYEYAQREFAEEDEDKLKKNYLGKGAAIGGAVGAAGMAGGSLIYNTHNQKKLIKSGRNLLGGNKIATNVYDKIVNSPSSKKALRKAKGKAALIDAGAGATIGALSGLGIGALKKRSDKKKAEQK